MANCRKVMKVGVECSGEGGRWGTSDDFDTRRSQPQAHAKIPTHPKSQHTPNSQAHVQSQVGAHIADAYLVLKILDACPIILHHAARSRRYVSNHRSEEVIENYVEHRLGE